MQMMLVHMIALWSLKGWSINVVMIQSINARGVTMFFLFETEMSLFINDNKTKPQSTRELY